MDSTVFYVPVSRLEGTESFTVSLCSRQTSYSIRPFRIERTHDNSDMYDHSVDPHYEAAFELYAWTCPRSGLVPVFFETTKECVVDIRVGDAAGMEC